MLLTDARNRLLVDLSDIDKELLTEDVLDRSIQRAVSDLSRFLPRDRIYEVTLIFTVPDEKWTSAAAAGTYVTLGNKPIKEASETVKNNDGTTCVRDTDYYIDYTNGKITHISGERIGEGEECTISYTKSKIIVDISSIIDDLVRVDRVEYPVGDIPQSFVPYELWEDLLTVKSEAMETQTAMTENEHVAIYYSSKHTAPTPSAEGTFPDFLDDTVILAASAYALFTLGSKYVKQSVTDMASLRTALGSIAAKHALAVTALAKVATHVGEADAALDKVTTYLETNETTDNAKDVLANITDDIAELRNKITTALDAAADALGDVSSKSLDKNTTGAEAYLDTGDEKIPTINVADDVSRRYSDYTRARVEIAQARITQAAAYAQEATIRLSNIRSYIEESSGWARIADSFTAEAAQRMGMAQTYIAEANGCIAQMDRYLAEAAQYRDVANMDLLLADRYKEMGAERRNEAWLTWHDPRQFAALIAKSSSRQATK